MWTLALPALAFGAAAYDPPQLQLVLAGAGKVTVLVKAGASGAPAGFTVKWMQMTDYIANGRHFYSGPNSVQGEGSFTGEPTLNTFRGFVADFALQPNETVPVEIGDLFDETGVTVAAPTEELTFDRTYVLAAHANGDVHRPASPLSTFVSGTTKTPNCTLTQGFWKNHEELWPVSGMWLGYVYYTKQQLLDILHEAVRGNGLSSLAHQLIATKLNLANNADRAVVEQTLLQAEVLIGNLVVPPIGAGTLDPDWTSPLTQTLDDFNNGVIGPGHCGTTAVEEVSWGRVKASYR